MLLTYLGECTKRKWLRSQKENQVILLSTPNQSDKLKTDLKSSITHLANPFNKVPARDFLMPGCSVRQELNTVLSGYMNYVTSLTPDKDSGKFKGLLDPSIYLPWRISSSK